MQCHSAAHGSRDGWHGATLVPRHRRVKQEPTRSRRFNRARSGLRFPLTSLANALVNQHIGLEETDDGVWAIYFNTVLLATLDERDFVIRG